MPSGFDTSMAGREMRKPLDTWMHMGVRRRDGSRFSRADVVGAVLLPDGAGGDAFMIYSNFAVIHFFWDRLFGTYRGRMPHLAAAGRQTVEDGGDPQPPAWRLHPSTCQ